MKKEKIVIKKEKGKVEVVVTLYLIALLFISVSAVICLFSVQVWKENMQDNIVTSALAAAVVDMEEMGKTGNVRLKEDGPQIAASFKNYMKINADLNEVMEPRNENSIITGPVVLNEMITCERIDSSEGVSYEVYHFPAGTRETVTTPPVINGETVEKTSIYVKVTIPIKTFFGIELDSVFSNIVGVDFK